jgi:hypothetical protein
VIEVRNSLAARIEALWTGADSDAGDEVIRASYFDVEAADLTGRKVWPLPEAYTNFSATRGEDTWDYSFQVWVVERYEEQGPIPEEWTEARMQFVEELFEALSDPRSEPLATQPGLYVQEGEVSTLYDVVDLVEAKLFVSVFTLLLREDRDA